MEKKAKHNICHNPDCKKYFYDAYACQVCILRRQSLKTLNSPSPIEEVEK
jgi:hypothetical protein